MHVNTKDLRTSSVFSVKVSIFRLIKLQLICLVIHTIGEKKNYKISCAVELI